MTHNAAPEGKIIAIGSTTSTVSYERLYCLEKMNVDTKWKQRGITVAGGNGNGDQLNQLSYPKSICVDDDQTIYISDCHNHRIIAWKCNGDIGQVVAGGHGQGQRNDQLSNPVDVIIDKVNDSLLISDRWNRRVVQWSRQNNTYGQVIISKIDCSGLIMDNNGFLYISNWKKNEVRRWKIGDEFGTIVAGGSENGDHRNQLSSPSYICIDKDYSIYVSDWNNRRVMNWIKDANKGIIMAGGNGLGKSRRKLCHPQGVIVDQLGQIYAADYNNHRVMRWRKGNRKGSVVVGGNGCGSQANQFNGPTGLSFDQQGNLYVVDSGNHRIQKFEIDLH